MFTVPPPTMNRIPFTPSARGDPADIVHVMIALLGLTASVQIDP
jgi:hypothetical protein